MAGPLRIGVNALFLIPGGVGGTEIYLRNLLASLAEIDAVNQYFVFLNAETEAALAPAAANFHAVPCPVRAVNRPARLLWEQFCLPVQAAARTLDVLFSPGFTSPLATFGCRKVTVIHDLQHVRQPENFARLELAAWRATVWISAHFSREIITVSENSRRDIVDVYGLPPERVHTIGHGVERAFYEPSPLGRRMAEPYLLSVSTIHPHKNWDRWLEAYRRLAAEGFPHHLVIAGLKGNYSLDLERLIEAKGLQDRVHPIGWVTREELVAWFQFARALVFPSTFEGFGMPVLEAMAAGVPVACSDIPPLHEAAGPAAQFFDPYSVDSIAAAVRRLLTDVELRRRLVALGRENAGNFTWTRAAEQTLSVLRSAAR
ncbi:MAG: glycosyltransferase family 4 protein [Acidobacteria bacterium]|nr:glycosyltransferase family 4 protein [Acidobacteriota bacterium]